MTMQAKHSWRTVLRAFWRALQMTLRGETYTPPPPAYPEVRVWISQGQALLKTIFETADAQGLDEAARKQHTLTLEGRPISMQTILAAVEHNFSREYGLLLDSGLEHSWLSLAAFNMNDRYRLSQLAASLPQSAALQGAIEALESHLAELPRPPFQSTGSA
jgi:hypothetical protein